MGGKSIVAKYGFSPLKILSAVYPEYKWLSAKFKHSSKNVWKNVDFQRQFVEYLGKELGIKDISDWYNVSLRVIKYSRYFLI